MATLTVITVSQDGDLGCWVVSAHSSAHGHAEADVEALFLLVQGVIDDDDATHFLTFVLIEAQDTVVVLRPSDVIRVGQDRAGDGTGGRG